MNLLFSMLLGWLLLFFGGWAIVALGYAATFLEYPHINPVMWEPEPRLFLYVWGFVTVVLTIAAAAHTEE